MIGMLHEVKTRMPHPDSWSLRPDEILELSYGFGSQSWPVYIGMLEPVPDREWPVWQGTDHRGDVVELHFHDYCWKIHWPGITRPGWYKRPMPRSGIAVLSLALGMVLAIVSPALPVFVAGMVPLFRGLYLVSDWIFNRQGPLTVKPFLMIAIGIACCFLASSVA